MSLQQARKPAARPKRRTPLKLWQPPAHGWKKSLFAGDAEICTYTSPFLAQTVDGSSVTPATPWIFDSTTTAYNICVAGGINDTSLTLTSQPDDSDAYSTAIDAQLGLTFGWNAPCLSDFCADLSPGIQFNGGGFVNETTGGDVDVVTGDLTYLVPTHLFPPTYALCPQGAVIFDFNGSGDVGCNPNFIDDGNGNLSFGLPAAPAGFTFRGPTVPEITQDQTEASVAGQATVPTIPATPDGAANNPGYSRLINGVCVGPTCAPKLPVGYPGLTLFSDSAGCGALAQPQTTDSSAPQFYSNQGYAWLLAADFGGTFTNYCNGSDESADLVRQWAMPYAQPTDSQNPTYIAEIGANDANGCGAGDDCIAAFTQILQSAIAWLAIPTNCKIYGQATTASPGGGGLSLGCQPIGPVQQTSGTWTADDFISTDATYNRAGTYIIPPKIPGVAISTTSSSASLTIPFSTTVPGQNVYCGWRSQLNTNTSSATITIDGVAPPSPLNTWNSHYSFHGASSTSNGTVVTVFVQYYAIATIGTHTIVVNVTGADSTDPFVFAWCGTAPQAIAVPNPAASASALPLTTVTPNPPVVPGSPVATAVYSGPIPSAAGNAYAGTWFFVSGFTQTDFSNATDDGPFLCVASSYDSGTGIGTLTMLNGSAVMPTAPVTGAATPALTQLTYEAGLPRVLMNGIPRLRKVMSPSILDSTTLKYDNVAQGIAVAYAQDGLQVSIAQVRSYLNTTQVGSSSGVDESYGGDLSYTDGVHPSTQGHQHVRDSYEAAVVNGYESRVYASASMPSCASFVTGATTSDTYFCPALTINSQCVLQPRNVLAANENSNTFIQSKARGSLVVVHPAKVGAQFDVVCPKK